MIKLYYRFYFYIVFCLIPKLKRKHRMGIKWRKAILDPNYKCKVTIVNE